jgi:phosphoglycolate phosphatase
VNCDLVLFDLDGTLVDSRYAITSCINHALAGAGLSERDPAWLEQFIGPPLIEVFIELGADELQAAACMESYRGRYPTTALTETPVFDGIAEMLAAIDAPKAVVTSKPAAYAEPIVEAVGLRGFFSHVFGPSLEARAEPKTETLGRALRSFEGRRPVMVGDRIHDIGAARAHGIPSIGVLWGIGSAEELAGADRLVDSPAELARTIVSATPSPAGADRRCA